MRGRGVFEAQLRGLTPLPDVDVQTASKMEARAAVIEQFLPHWAIDGIEGDGVKARAHAVTKGHFEVVGPDLFREKDLAVGEGKARGGGTGTKRARLFKLLDQIDGYSAGHEDTVERQIGGTKLARTLFIQ